MCKVRPKEVIPGASAISRELICLGLSIYLRLVATQDVRNGAPSRRARRRTGDDLMATDLGRFRVLSPDRG
jgi:hypothetical protein